MGKLSLPLLLCIFCFSFSSNAQQTPPCGFDLVHQQQLARDTGYSRRTAQNDQFIRQYISTHPQLLQRESGLATTYTIPVVVHVMHTGGAVGTTYNPTDAQIAGAIAYLNQVYAGTYPGMQAPVEGGGIVDMEIQFALAQRTPSCGATNGIDRVDASALPNYTNYGINVNNSNGCSEVTLKNLARWNTSDYYNIWLVNKIDGADGTAVGVSFIAGFAYFPGSSSSLDGTIMLASQMVAGQKTLPHEIGHALNLYHPFEGSANNTQCPTNSDCTTNGDRVCDTDPIYHNYNATTQAYSFTCRSGSNSCASPNNYSINTESNYMSYTNCYTLFTNGQKARAQAAMLLASRASLVSASNMALTPCSSVINFSEASATSAETSAGTVSGCRTYTDYNLTMTVGQALTATATATLTFSGTATKGLDYEVTTNGNFATPSSVVTFASGATTSQPVTIRVYDDANVESSETIILDFTVANGGGNAVKGTTNPSFTLTLSDDDIAPAATSTGTVTLGTTTYSMNATFDAKQQKQRGQYLYKASELTAAGLTAGSLVSFGMNFSSKLSTRAFSNFTIKMANTTTTNLYNSTVTVINGMTTVYSNASYTSSAGWNMFTLSTPFTWDGTSSIAIEICFSNATADATNGNDAVVGYSDGGSASQGNMFYQSGIDCSGSYSSVSVMNNGIKPMARFGYSTTGTAVETTATSTSTNHIATGSSDYFYSNNGKLMMKLSSVGASLGCVTTTLDGAGNTWVSALGGQRSSKVFKVTPTTNTATTSYTISLYFDNAELAGKTATSLMIAKTSAASAASATSGNTVLATPTVTTLGSGITVFTASFTGFSSFFLVENVTLPVELTDFKATVTADNNNMLRWNTSSEHNSRRFDIEASQDGASFSYLASVAAQGNSTTAHQYEYLHVSPPSGTTWYRLKQVDMDNRFIYSKIVSAHIDKPLQVSVFPIPASNTITISFGAVLAQATIEIYASDMRLVKKEVVANASMQREVNVSGLASGVYFVRVAGPEGVSLVRFVKK